MNRVVSYVLFRHNNSAYESLRCGDSRGKFFAGFLPALVRAHHHVWKDWILTIHHDDRVREFPYFEALSKMHLKGLLRLVPVGEAKTLCGRGGMLERFRPAFDVETEYLVCRDIDSLPMPRDRKMVEQFMAANAVVHVIHDSESHGDLMGGTIAVQARRFRELTGLGTFDELLARGSGIDMNVHGGDQVLLNREIYHWVWRHLFLHAKKRSVDMRCMAALQVLPKECDEDRLFNHIGGVGDADTARRFYDERFPNEAILECER